MTLNLAWILYTKRLNDKNLRHKTLDETIARDSTINHSLLEMAAKLLGSSGLVTVFVWISFYTVQESSSRISWSEIKSSMTNIPLYSHDMYLKAVKTRD